MPAKPHFRRRRKRQRRRVPKPPVWMRWDCVMVVRIPSRYSISLEV